MNNHVLIQATSSYLASLDFIWALVEPARAYFVEPKIKGGKSEGCQKDHMSTLSLLEPQTALEDALSSETDMEENRPHPAVFFLSNAKCVPKSLGCGLNTMGWELLGTTFTIT